uniref:ATP synthase F0 subunit 8 n=1 Tax=Troglocarcinus corallicola TaxID=1903116 RepID=UPI0028D80529|nr:ATP synthase F0 subunit 8 [Troglocarcinus corallicola]WMY25255.1 ATP synthase F0 subunit 8 [Troglocarcinus corallicola]
MPQMAPIYWLNLFCMFLFTLLLFFMLNYYIKPFSKMTTSHISSKNTFKHWKL